MSSATESKRRIRWRALVVLGSVFLAGTLFGIFVDHLMLLRQGRLIPAHGMQFVSAHVVRSLDGELALSDEQEAVVKEIIDRRHRNISARWRNVRPEIRQELDAAATEIEATLTPEQRRKFGAIRERWRKHASRVGRHLD